DYYCDSWDNSGKHYIF
nr:immunoglobulin light chain junction region [Macaca mulatta]